MLSCAGKNVSYMFKVLDSPVVFPVKGYESVFLVGVPFDASIVSVKDSGHYW